MRKIFTTIVLATMTLVGTTLPAAAQAIHETLAEIRVPIDEISVSRCEPQTGPVHFTGEDLLQVTYTETPSGRHLIRIVIRTNIHGQGLITNLPYNFIQVTTGAAPGTFTGGSASTNSYITYLRVRAPGGREYVVHEDINYTVNANGTVTVDSYRFTSDDSCFQP